MRETEISVSSFINKSLFTHSSTRRHRRVVISSALFFPLLSVSQKWTPENESMISNIFALFNDNAPKTTDGVCAESWFEVESNTQFVWTSLSPLMLLLFLVSPLRPAERMSSQENALRQQQKIKLNIMKKGYTKKIQANNASMRTFEWSLRCVL